MGLIAVSLAASAAADSADVASQIAATGRSKVTEGLALFNQCGLTDGLSYVVVNGDNNLLIAAPEDALLAQIKPADEPLYYTYFDAVSRDAPFANDVV